MSKFSKTFFKTTEKQRAQKPTKKIPNSSYGESKKLVAQDLSCPVTRSLGLECLTYICRPEGRQTGQTEACATSYPQLELIIRLGNGFTPLESLKI